MRARSLATRLFLAATAWVVLILVLTGIGLSTVYKRSTERAFDRRLNFYLRTLIAEATEPDETGERSEKGGKSERTDKGGKNQRADKGEKAREPSRDRSVQSLGEPLFELPLSGWYWRMARIDGDKKEVRASRSLWDATLPKLEDEGVELDPSGVRLGYVTGPENQRLRMVERQVDLGADGKYLAQVAGDATEIEDEVWNFNTYVAGTFVALSIGLLLTTLFQVRYGLAPLKRISASLSAIRSGHAERLEGEFPREIAPLARETNALIDANRAIVERSRTHVGNLAHAIKTPLSVIVNEATASGNDPLAAKVLEQADIMRNQVAHHLERARIAARVQNIATITEVGPVVEALARTMEKIHRARDLLIEAEIAPGARFRGERQDLEEMAGNLVDNACKWAAHQVVIEVLAERGPGGAQDPVLRIIVDDDGPGLSPLERTQVARRGQRLDETKPGSGLGLSIVTDLALLYGGSLTLSAAPIGGLRAELALPGV
jgi:signal transduction histidine kinase